MAKAIINANRSKGTINKNIYGHFSEHLGRCIYGGIYVGDSTDIPNINGMRSDVVEALKKMGIPLLRWPGGCFADTYHWQDGIGPQSARKRSSTPIGAGSRRTTPSEPMSSWSCAGSWAARRI